MAWRSSGGQWDDAVCALGEGEGEALAGVVAPGAGGVEADVVLPVLAGFEGGAELVADEGEVVVGVGVAGIDTDSDAEVAAGGFEVAEFVEDTAEIEVSDGVVGIAGDGPQKTSGGVFEVTLFVGEHTQIDQRFNVIGSDRQNAAVGVDGLQMGIGIGFVLQGEREPIVGVALWHDADFVTEFPGVEIEDELAGDGFEVRAVVIDDDVAAVGEDAEFGERLFDFREFLI